MSLPYIDRKVSDGAFRELLSERPAYRVLNIYGNSGIGKSRFLQYLKDRYLIESKKLIYIEINFEDRVLHKPQKAIMHIAKELESRYDFNFMALWKAYAILWQKRYEHSPIMYAADLPYFSEVKKLIKVDKKGNPFVDIAKGLFGDRVSKELEELKMLDSRTIEERLYKFFASDLRNIVKKNSDFNDIVFLLDNVELLKEHSNTTPCSKDAWIRELITNVGKDALFVLTSKEELNWKSCNSGWKDVVKSIKLDKFAKNDALRYISTKIDNIELKEAIVLASGLEPFWLSLAVTAYQNSQKYNLPTSKKDILDTFVSNLDSKILKLLKIFTHARFFTKDMIKIASKQFDIGVDNNLILKLLNYSFVKTISRDKYIIDSSLKEQLESIENDLEGIEYRAFLFSYYENMLQSLDQELIKNTPKVIDVAIEEAWYHLNLINHEPLVHFEWLDYYIDRFYMYAAWELFVDRYTKILPKLETAEDKVSQNRLISLYNNLAGLYESLGEAKIAKEYYNKVIELNRPKLLSA